MADTGIRIGVDTGGTFTDLVIDLGTNQPWVTHKLPSTPHDPAQAALQGIAEILAKAKLLDAQPSVIHGSTVATNALLEGKGANTAFVTTVGFEDTLHIGRQNRPELYALEPKRQAPPVSREHCFGMQGRMDYLGKVVTPLKRTGNGSISNSKPAHSLDSLTKALNSAGVEAVAVSLLHSYANPEHEQQIAEAIRSSMPDVHLTLSSELLPEFREYERGATCIANSAVAPLMAGYIGKLVSELGGENLRVMASAGGSLPPESVISEPVHTVLSGPAGGVCGALALSKLAGHGRIITFDMGGTSTDVSLCDEAASTSNQGQINGLPIRVPMLDIETVGAGGGSIAWVDKGGALKVGPQSAGANPGPACYGKQAGELQATVTDANAVLGHLPASQQLAGTLPIDVGLARKAIEALAQKAGLGIEQTAEGILRIAETTMARAVRRVSVERGFDPRNFTLVSFGGAGGLHCAKLAELLGMQRVLIPPNPGLLSAVGMVNSTAQYDFSQAIMHTAPDTGLDFAELSGAPKVHRAIHSLKARASRALDAENVPAEQQQFSLSLDLRFTGQSHELNIPFTKDVISDFKQLHEKLYGYLPEGRGIEVIAARIRAIQIGVPLELQQILSRSEALPPLVSTPIKLFTDKQLEGRLYQRHDLLAGDVITGPAVVSEYSATTYVPANWSVDVDRFGNLFLTQRANPGRKNKHATKQAAPVELEIYNHLFASIAEEMGVRLMRSAYSPNIKERRDFSCALFDATGEMIAQAAHIPVHLGAMPLSVQAVLQKFKPAKMKPGDRFVVNDPFAGGTHLPDITVVAPMFMDTNKAPAFFVANRAHHSDVGGLTPGSMGLATNIEDEGIRIPPSRLDQKMVAQICKASRTPDERRGDLLAQQAALNAGVEALEKLCAEHTAPHVMKMGLSLIAYSAAMMAAIVESIPDGTYYCSDVLDDDGHGKKTILIHCKLTIQDSTAKLDFSKSAKQVTGPMNAVRAITESAVAYCFRCLAPGGFPSNSGMTATLEFITKPGTILDATYPAAVAAGNVETSQRITDVVFGALALAMPGRIPAASQGTMNNITLGGYDPIRRRSFAYYETIGGGCGAGPNGDGANGLHSHMTNTLNTPVEAFEHEYPLRITNYSIGDNGGAGLFSGGGGLRREYEALVTTEITVLSERRRSAPPGENLGGAGAVGCNTLVSRTTQQGGRQAGKFSTTLNAGDRLRIATPGGGGWGLQHKVHDHQPPPEQLIESEKQNFLRIMNEAISTGTGKKPIAKHLFRKALIQRYSRECNAGTALSATGFMQKYENLIHCNPTFHKQTGTIHFTNPSPGKQKRSGSYYTPPALANLILDHALQPILQQALDCDNPQLALINLQILDPACGSGRFLLAAFQRLLYAFRLAGGELTPETLSQLANCIHGSDTNQLAVDLCQASLCFEAGGKFGFALKCEDGVLAKHAHPYDVIIGNPPFVNAINRGVKRKQLTKYRVQFPEITGAADLATFFLSGAVRSVKAGGRIGFVLPRSVLNSPTLATLRAELPAQLQPNLVFCPTESKLFVGAAVFVCALVLGADDDCLLGQGKLGGDLKLIPGKITPGNWWAAIADIGTQTHSHKQPATGKHLGDCFEVQASMTAGQAYHLVPLLADGGRKGLKLVTTGLIDPGECLWGTKLCRYLKQDYSKPRIAGEATAHASLARRLKTARRPKVIVAGLSARIECMFDRKGEYCGAVSTYSIFHPTNDRDALAELCRYLNSLASTATFIRELGANALGGGNITMKKSFLKELWLPKDG